MGEFKVRTQAVLVRGGVEIEFLGGIRSDRPGQAGRPAVSVIVDGRHHRVHFDINGWASRVECLPLPATADDGKG